MAEVHYNPNVKDRPKATADALADEQGFRGAVEEALTDAHPDGLSRSQLYRRVRQYGVQFRPTDARARLDGYTADPAAPIVLDDGQYHHRPPRQGVA